MSQQINTSVKNSWIRDFFVCFKYLAIFLILMPSAWASAQEVKSITLNNNGVPIVYKIGAEAYSPNKTLKVQILNAPNGSAYYRVLRNDKEVISPSRLGFILANDSKLDLFLGVVNSQTKTIDETWEQAWGESKLVRNNYTELNVNLSEYARQKRGFAVVFRVFDDGIGFRYAFDEKVKLKKLEIVEELTEFNISEDGTAWWIPGGEFNRYEQLYHKTPLREVGQAHTPMTIKTNSGLYLAFHEAALVDYSAMWLRRFEGTKFRANLSPSPRGAKVTREVPFVTPWRTIRITNSPADLYMSNLELNLNEPNKLGDVSWVKPHKYVGIWWEMHIGKSTWERGEKHGATTANAKRHIDFAAKHGFRGVLIEGWNVGWESDWFASGDGFDFLKAYPDFDLKEVADYARQKGVRIVGHHETAGNVAKYDPQMEDAFALYNSLGVDSVKTGYVADAGGIKIGKEPNTYYTWHDGQEMQRHHLKVVETAAKYKISVNPHEPIKDTGLRRTYPNWVSREGARGMEYNAWGEPINPVHHEIDLVFTRMLSGPMDYTPGILSLVGIGDRKLNSTMAKQLASYLVIYSPIQMVADLPENYEANLGPFQFIKDVPTDWEFTKVIAGEVGQYVVMARKDRNSREWYLGGITDGNMRQTQTSLKFLEPGINYTAEIYRDANDSDYRKETRKNIIIEKRRVNSNTQLPIRMAPGGGFAIRFIPEK